MRASYFIVMLSILCSLRASYAQDWQKLKSEHFIVNFLQDESFAKEVLDKAEVDYRDIASDLGYPRYSEFWTWENRVNIYIYADHASFLRETGQPDWSHGMADYKKKQIASYAWGRDFVESLLPHEIGHLIFRDFVGFRGEVPLWLDEGVAQWAERKKRDYMKAMAKKAYDEDCFLTLTDMMKLDIRSVTDSNRVYVRTARRKTLDKDALFLSRDKLIEIYYLQSVSLIGFLIEKYGTDSFTEFCRQLREGNKLEKALNLAYSVHIHNLDELEFKWREYLAAL